jgi:hypothetical protein
MKFNGYLSALSATLALILLSRPVSAVVLITEVHSGGSSSTYNGDWFELTNTGPAAVDLTSGWSMDDDTNVAGTAPLAGVGVLDPGATAVFIEGTATNIANFKLAWFGASVPLGFLMGSYSGSGIGLSSSGDQVNIFNGTTKVAGVNFGAGNASVTFDNSVGITGNGVISTLSVAGVNGAFVSFNGLETGSPGLAVVPVPEPAGLGVAGVFGVLALMRRRKAR